jgi:hypothetical protein
MKVLVSMAPSLCPPRYIVKIIDPLDIKRDVALSLDKSQVAARFPNLGKFYDFAMFKTHGRACIVLVVGVSLYDIPQEHLDV